MKDNNYGKAIGIILILFFLGGCSVRENENELAKDKSIFTFVEETKLELIKWNFTNSENYFYVKGLVKNISSKSIESVEAIAICSDKNDEFVTSDNAMIEYSPLLPGQTSPFEVMVKYNPEIKSARVSFKQIGGGELMTKHSEK